MVERFDLFKDIYAELDKDEKDEFNAALGKDLAAALADGSKTRFESKLETTDDLDTIWEKVRPLISIE